MKEKEGNGGLSELVKATYTEFHVKDISHLLPSELAAFVNKIYISESTAEDEILNLPFYADGYPGLMFQQSDNGFYILPRNKKLSELFLYGQTIEPISLEVKGPYKLIVFQLYPFASKYLLNVDPKELNDDCYDLLSLSHIDIKAYYRALQEADKEEEAVRILSETVLQLLANQRIPEDDRIQRIIQQIIAQGGQAKIKDICGDAFLTERTLQRNFLSEVGLSPKQFSTIIQFQNSFHKLSSAQRNKLSDVGFDSGFTDQSHFIRVFKRYTGQTPSRYLKQLYAG